MSARTYKLQTGKYDNVRVTVSRRGVFVYLHENLIVRYKPNSDRVVFDTCGYMTISTARAMNRFLDESCLSHRGEVIMRAGDLFFLRASGSLQSLHMPLIRPGSPFLSTLCNSSL